jgi:ketosteroid isomerase-like protein
MRRAWLAAALGAAAVGYWAGAWRAEAARDEHEALMQLDRDFDQMTSKGGSEVWVSFFADDGIMMPQGGSMAVGRDAIRKAITETFAAPGYSLRWEPVDAAVSGPMGYTYGLYKASRQDASGKPVTSYGKYVTIWKRQRDGWKVAVDIGNASPPPKQTEAAGAGNGS